MDVSESGLAMFVSHGKNEEIMRHSWHATQGDTEKTYGGLQRLILCLRIWSGWNGLCYLVRGRHSMLSCLYSAFLFSKVIALYVVTIPSQDSVYIGTRYITMFPFLPAKLSVLSWGVNSGQRWNQHTYSPPAKRQIEMNTDTISLPKSLCNQFTQAFAEIV